MQHDLAVGKLQRIMMRARIIHVHLPESRHSVRQDLCPSEEKLEAGKMALDLVLKSNLCPWKEANRYSRFVRRREAPGGGIPELRGDQLIPDLCRPGRNAVQTVVAHGQRLLFKSTPAAREDVIKKSFGGRMLSSDGAYPPSDIGPVPPRRMARTQRTAAIV
jgi:hypothetical protein